MFFVGYVFRLEKGCFGEEEGGHGRAWEHGGACQVSGRGCFGFTRVCKFGGFVFGCNLGHLATLALIPNDVCDSPNDQDKLGFVDFAE